MESKFSLIDMISKYKLTKTVQPVLSYEKMPNQQSCSVGPVFIIYIPNENLNILLSLRTRPASWMTSGDHRRGQFDTMQPLKQTVSVNTHLQILIVFQIGVASDESVPMLNVKNVMGQKNFNKTVSLFPFKLLPSF